MNVLFRASQCDYSLKMATAVTSYSEEAFFFLLNPCFHHFLGGSWVNILDMRLAQLNHMTVAGVVSPDGHWLMHYLIGNRPNTTLRHSGGIPPALRSNGSTNISMKQS